MLPNHSDTPRPTNPGELNFLAKPVRLVLSSSQQTCFPLRSAWLLLPTHLDKPGTCVPWGSGREKALEGLLQGMEHGKGGNHPDLPARGTSIPGSVLNPMCCVITGHTLEQGDRQGWFASARPANLLHFPHLCWEILSCFFPERSGKCWSSKAGLLLLIVEWFLPRGWSYTGSLAPGEFHATQRGVQGALLSVQGHPMGGFCLCWTETLGLLSPCRY